MRERRMLREMQSMFQSCIADGSTCLDLGIDAPTVKLFRRCPIRYRGAPHATKRAESAILRTLTPWFSIGEAVC